MTSDEPNQTDAMETATRPPNDGFNASTPRFGPPGPGGKGAVEYVLGNVWVRAAAYVAIGILVLLLLWNTRHAYTFAITVALVGYLLAYILNPIVTMLTRLRMGRGLAVGIVYFLLVIVVIVGSFLLAQVIGQLGEFLRLIPSALEGLTPLVTGVVDAAHQLGLPAWGGALGAMFGWHFVDGPVRTFEDAQRVDSEFFARFYRACLERGVFLPASPYEAMFLSTAHTDADIDQTIERLTEAMQEARQ